MTGEAVSLADTSEGWPFFLVVIDLDYETIGGQGSNMLMVTASGTAVVVSG